MKSAVKKVFVTGALVLAPVVAVSSAMTAPNGHVQSSDQAFTSVDQQQKQQSDEFVEQFNTLRKLIMESDSREKLLASWEKYMAGMDGLLEKYKNKLPLAQDIKALKGEYCEIDKNYERPTRLFDEPLAIIMEKYKYSMVVERGVFYPQEKIENYIEHMKKDFYKTKEYLAFEKKNRNPLNQEGLKKFFADFKDDFSKVKSLDDLGNFHNKCLDIFNEFNTSESRSDQIKRDLADLTGKYILDSENAFSQRNS